MTPDQEIEKLVDQLWCLLASAKFKGFEVERINALLASMYITVHATDRELTVCWMMRSRVMKI